MGTGLEQLCEPSPSTDVALNITCDELSLLVLYSSLRGFSLGHSGFPLSTKTTEFDFICCDLVVYPIIRTTVLS